MIVLVLCIIAGLAAALAFGLIGYLLGYNAKSVRERLEALEERREPDDDSAIVDTSPQRVRERHQTEDPDDDDDSGIVRVKSPKEMKAAHDRQVEEEIDKITRGAIR